MINRFFMDFVKTCGKGMLISIEPKMTRADRNNPKSPQVQASDDNGLKWTVTVSVPVQGFDKVKQENIEITVTAPNRPFTSIPLGHYVIVESMEVGILKSDKTGYNVYFSAENIKPAPPERATAGQEANKGGNS